MVKIYKIAAAVMTASEMFLASGVGEALRKLFEWMFDKGCDPSKHNLPNWEDVVRLFM